MDQVRRGHRNLLVAAASATAILVAMGGVVCSTNASGGCPDWPRCHGQLVPPLATNSIIEYSHRAVALIAVALVIVSAVAGRKAKGSLRWLPLLTLLLMFAVAMLGRAAVLTGLTPPVAALDLGSALLALALITACAVIADVRHPLPAVRESGFPIVTALTLVSFFAVVVTGVLFARGTVMRCVGGPLELGGWSALANPRWLESSRQALGALAAGLAAMTYTLALRPPVDQTTRRWSVAFAILFVGECLLNAAMVSTGPVAPLLIASVTATVAAWCALVVVAVRSRMLTRYAASSRLAASHV